MQNHEDKYSELRKKAHSILKDSGLLSLGGETDIKQLIEEFSVYQIELELQNDELIQIRNELEASKQYLDSLFNHAPVGYIVLGSDGLIRDVNQTAARYFDIQISFLKGQRFKAFIPQAHLIEYNACMKRLLEQNTSQSMEICFRIKAGYHFWAKTDMRVLRPPITAEPYILCALTDISKEKETEKQLNLLKDGLEETVRTRTAELTEINARLRKEIKIREETDRRKAEIESELQKAKKLETVGLLAGGIAHDFNNLLSVIVGNIELAKDYRHESDYLRHLEIAADACFKGKGLTSRLITFSRGGSPMKKTGDISEVIRECCRFAVAGSNTDYACTVPEDLWMTEFDEYQFRHALSNIIKNAVESMPGGGIVRITAENIVTGALQSGGSEKKAGKYILLAIQDHGVGIPENILPLIFDPYFSTKERGSEKGMGLGLSIAHSIISKHNGHISAESEIGKGTTVHIRLPAHSEYPPPSVPDIPAVIRTDVPEKAVNKGKKILFMDDEEMVREFIEKLLIHSGYSVVPVKDGKEAVREYRKAMASGEPFSAVILDLTIRGGMGGKETISKLKEAATPRTHSGTR